MSSIVNIKQNLVSTKLTLDSSLHRPTNPQKKKWTFWSNKNNDAYETKIFFMAWFRSEWNICKVLTPLRTSCIQNKKYHHFICLYINIFICLFKKWDMFLALLLTNFIVSSHKTVLKQTFPVEKTTKIITNYNARLR